MNNWPNKYKILESTNLFTLGDYNLVPIRFKDRYLIMKWRNEQIYHLRQSEKLTKKQQDDYFNSVVFELFNLEKPNQILFSLLKKNKLIAYGGLVHINWTSKEAEISFLIDTILDKEYFRTYWDTFIKIIQNLSFINLSFNRIYTFSFNLRPKLYDVLEKNNFKEERRIKNKYFKNGKYVVARIHAKYSNNFEVKKATYKDKALIYKWSNDQMVRKNSINSNKIEYKDHEIWYKQKLLSNNTMFFLVYELNIPVGSFRIDSEENEFLISFVVSPEWRNKKIGKKIITYIVNNFSNKNLVAKVLEHNIVSQKIFMDNGFKAIRKELVNNKNVIKFIRYSND